MNPTPQPPSPEQLARILGTKFYAARHPVEFEAALAELAGIIRENEELKKQNGWLRKDLQEIAVGCEVGCPDQEEAKRRIIAIKAERDSFREKAEALDWLELNRVDVQYHIGDSEVGEACGYELYFSNGSGQYSKAFSYQTLLSAINSARKEQSK